MEILTWCSNNLLLILGIMTALSTFFVAIAKLTKNKKDDKWAGYFVKILSAVKKILMPTGAKKQ